MKQVRFALALENTVESVATARTGDRDWLATHGPAAARLIAVDGELRTRDAAHTHAASRLERIDRHPLEAPDLGRDLDTFDLGR